MRNLLIACSAIWRISTLTIFLLSSCSQQNSEGFQPKPKGFNRIELPPHAYLAMKEEHPYTFEVSKAAIVQRDTFAKAELHWIILYYPSIEARLQLTYKPVLNDPKRLQDFINDAYKLAGKHQVKATSEQTKLAALPNGKMAVLIELEGEVPSHFQFYTTDTTKNYLRGAVYLMHATENDSLRPVVDYMKIEAMHLLETLKWRK
jgi:gliding motility-associated lipoprotein GldD